MPQDFGPGREAMQLQVPGYQRRMQRRPQHYQPHAVAELTADQRERGRCLRW